MGDSPLVSLVIGAILTMMGTVVGYYFGSSQGSKDKDGMLDAIGALGRGSLLTPSRTPPEPGHAPNATQATIDTTHIPHTTR